MQIFKIWNAEVIDGDTLIADIKLPFRLSLIQQKIRIAKIDAPEVDERGGSAATQFMTDFLHCKTNQRIWLLCGGKIDGKYGRIIGDLVKIDNPAKALTADRYSTLIINAKLATKYPA